MELLLARVVRKKASTLGVILNADSRELLCYSLEDREREIAGQPVMQWKIPKVTAIPKGRYKVVWTYSNRFKRYTLELLNVPGFTGIRIHAGNTAEDTDGCICAGTAPVADYTAVTESVVAVDKLTAVVMKNLTTPIGVWLTIC